MKKILILGGGFAGVEAAIRLQKSKRFDVTLVSDRDFLYIYPISIWVPVRSIDFEKVKIPLAKIRKRHGFNLLIDKVTAIKAEKNQVVLERQVLSYDYLIVAFGGSKMQPKGVENTTTICGTPDQTLELRSRIDELIARGSGKIAIGFGGNPNDKSAVRGGPAFELMFNLHYYLKKKGLRDRFDLTMFAPMAEPGARMGKGAMKAIRKMFNQFGIDQSFGKKIIEFLPDRIVFEDHSGLATDLTVFVAAGSGSPVLKNSDLPLSVAGFVQVNDFNQVAAFPNVFAIGDAAAYEGPEWTAKQGHVAEMMAAHAAFNIIRLENGGNGLKGYREKLSIICVMDMGKGAAFVYRDDKREVMVPMPVFGHWLKQAWGLYTKWTKLGWFPKII